MTLQEKIQISVNVTFVGVVVVFLVLTLLIIIIGIFARILRRPSKPDDADGNGIAQADADYITKDDDAEPADAVLQLDTGNEPGNEQGNELIAAIMAAISVVMGQAGFRLRTIRRTGRKTPSWNLSGRDEYLSTRL
jgi:Na+-transporting methylmalonyl-CoA/oxaloacetate decarboxylase gamma subunit